MSEIRAVASDAQMVIIAADRVMDGRGSHARSEKVIASAVERGLRVQKLQVAPLKVRWRREIPPGFVRGACCPMVALEVARDAFSGGTHDCLVLRGRDHLRSEWAGRRMERNGYMEVFGPGVTPLVAYTILAEQLLERWGLSPLELDQLSERLFQNYERTYRRLDPAYAGPDERWREKVTPFFRGIDCANPAVDFSGCLVVCPRAVASRLEIPDGEQIAVLGSAYRQCSDSDGLESIPDILSYAHLERAFFTACEEAGVDFREAFLAGRAALEVYTCFPVVPLAFLLATGFVDRLADAPAFLAAHAITITGGLNLGKAAWNNTTLNHLIAAVELLRGGSPVEICGVHGNAAVGYQQGFTILARA